MDINAITLGVAKTNGAVTVLEYQKEIPEQTLDVQASTTQGETYSRVEVWSRHLGVVYARDYAFTPDVGPDLIVAPASAAMDYHGTAPTYTLEAIGLQPDDTISEVTTGTPVYTVKDSEDNTVTVTTANAGTYKIALSGVSLASGYLYNFATKDGTLTIKKVKLTITAADKTMKEFADAPEYSVNITGFVSGESPSNLTGSLSYTIKDSEGNTVADVSTAAPGEYSIVPSGYTSGNYDIEYVAGKLTIEALPDLTITAVDKTMTAGGSEPVYAVEYDGFEDGDDASDLTGSIIYTIKDSEGETVADVTTADPGTYQIVPSGVTSDDYDIHFVAGTLTIEAE